MDKINGVGYKPTPLSLNCKMLCGYILSMCRGK